MFDRYIWAIKLATRNGFVVLADDHSNSDPTVVNNVTFWLQACCRHCLCTSVSVLAAVPMPGA